MSVFAFTNNATTEIAKADFNLNTALGQGVDYGVIANDYTWSGDTESNVMVGTYYSNAADIGASTNYSNAGGNIYIGQFNDWQGNKASGEGNTMVRPHQPPEHIYLGDEAYQQYNDKVVKFEGVKDTKIEHKVINVAGVVSAIGTNFNAYAGKGGTFDNTKKNVIDLRDKEAGTYVIQYSGNDINENVFDIYLNSNQRLLINCTTSNALKIGRYRLNGKQPSEYNFDQAEADDWYLQAVAFNIPNATSVELQETMGVVVAPNATATITNTSAGILVANKAVGQTGEWHYHNHNLEAPEAAKLELN